MNQSMIGTSSRQGPRATRSWRLGGKDAVFALIVLSASLFGALPSIAVAADLTVTKTNDTAGSGSVGTPFNWTLTLSNPGTTDAYFGDGEAVLTDHLPDGPTYPAYPVAGNANDAFGGINCEIDSLDYL